MQERKTKNSKPFPKIPSDALLNGTVCESFAKCGRPNCKPKNRHRRKPTWSEESPQGRWRAYTYEELLQRDKVSLDILWISDDELDGDSDAASLDETMAEIVYDLRAALVQFEDIQSDLRA